MQGNTHVLPDSRLGDLRGSQMVDWETPSGVVVRIEVVPIFCANCGIPYGHVPKDNTTFVCWLCRPCYEQFGTAAGTYAVPEDEFNKSVAEEMERKFGRHLTDLEIFQKMQQGELGKELELLVKESPYLVYRDAVEVPSGG